MSASQDLNIKLSLNVKAGEAVRNCQKVVTSLRATSKSKKKSCEKMGRGKGAALGLRGRKKKTKIMF